MFNELSENVTNEISAFEQNVNDNIEQFEHDTTETVNEYIEKFTELHDYVYYYFDNLDVQEEINNKLDQMADDGELEDIIRLYINKQVEYIFPKFWADQYSQDCTIIKGYDKNIAIDCGSESNWTNIQAMFSDNEVEKLDYFILSHYDSDHVGNLNNLIISGIIDSDTVVYLPVVPDRFSSVQPTETTVKATLTANNITFSTPTEGQKLEIDADFDITFGNLNKAYMEDNYNNYNYTSIVCLIRHKDTTAFFAGDAGTPTYKYLYDTKFITSTVDLYKQGHHGIDLNTYPQFIEQIKPKYVVQEGGIKDFGRGIFQCGETSLLIAMGCNYYATYMSDDYVTFSSTGYSMINDYGYNGAYSCTGQSLTLYVDADVSSDQIQNGSQDYPFEDLNQAFGYIYNYPTSEVTINLADGSYNVETSEVDNLSSLNSCTVIVNGNSEDNTAVTLKGVHLRNINVEFNYVTFDDTANPIIRVDDAYCKLDHCNVTPSSTVARGIVATRGSSLVLINTYFNNCTSAVAGYDGATLAYGDNVTFGNCTYKEENNKGLIGNKFIHDVIFADNENGSYTINGYFENYSSLKIYVRNKTSNEIQFNKEIVNPTNGKSYNTSGSWFNIGNNDIHIVNVDLRLRSGNVLWVSAEYDTDISSGGLTPPTAVTGQYEVYKIEAIS